MTSTDEKLTIIDLDQLLRGYRKFISAFVWREGQRTFVVDPGPRSTIPRLLEALAEMSIQSLDYVLLTHIHLDHSGGVGQLLEAFPMARVYCHPSGVRHLIDPARLWAGSQQVLGPIADLYGKPTPVEQTRFVGAEELATSGIEAIEAPGHAPHHVAFLVDEVCFVGEALGTTLELPSGRPYLRPAAPPRFYFDEACASIDRLAALNPEPSSVAFAHYGVAGDLRAWCRRAREQLTLWLEAAREVSSVEPLERERLYFELLQQRDPLYGQGRYDELPEDLKVRERHFLGNTLAGMLGYLGEGR